MTLMRVLAVAGFALLAPLMVRAVQEPPKPASLEGVVTRAGAGTPLPGARVTITALGEAPSGARGGLGGVPPEEQAQLEALIRQGLIDPGVLEASSGGRSKASEPIPFATTDGQGKFVFNNLSPGRYRLQVKANGYVPLGSGQRSSLGPEGVLTLVAGEVRSDLAFSLIPAGNVSGHLRDTFRQPVPNVPVQLLRPVYDANGQRKLQPVGNSRTDDHGEYRFYWVTPGRYYLRAGTPGGSSALNVLMALGGGAGADGGRMSSPNEVSSDVGLAFYPGVLDASGARAVEIGPGEEAGGVDWAVPPQPSPHTVRGRVIDARTGKSPARATVIGVPLNDGSASGSRDGVLAAVMGTMGAAQNYDSATGRLELRNLAPGAYQVTAVVEDPPPNGEGARGRGGFSPDGEPAGFGGISSLLGLASGVSGTTIVVVGDADIEDVLVTAAPPTVISGRLTLEGELPARPAPRGGVAGPRGGGGRGGINPANAGLGLNVQLVPLREDLLSSLSGYLGAYGMAGAGGRGGAGRTAADGTFQFSKGSGEYRITVVPLPPGAYLKEARMAGADVLGAPLVLPGPAGSLDVVVSMHGGEINGLAVDRRGTAAPTAQVVLVPDRSRGRTDLYKTVNAGPDGRFSMKGVVPGDYRIFSWEEVEPFLWFDPEFIENSQDKGSPVHVSESSVENVEVKIIPVGGAR